MLGQTWIAIPCGNKEKHGQHFHVKDGTQYACFGYTPIEE